MLLSHPPKFLQRIYSSLLWFIPNQESGIYLTFDDGPTPLVTPKVLALLKKYNAKATFFCLGKNIESNPNLFQLILDAGHQIGNHTYSHLNGWKTNNSVYLKDIEACQKLVKSNLFRPPYGKINSAQIKRLRTRYKIIMWSILTRDYDPRITKEKCLKLSLHQLKPGSILVFHDSIKAENNMLYALEGVLKYAQKHELKCEIIQ
ncbi:MAG: polysaccharide deacetylase family protein [Bacteroidetes bacterium]|nr:polysaccharide deacetylase family protein [Bacteroidota bacterium]MCB0802541.1 polysaccharide deacetylase family protein [Flavobacteriales bacterium]NOG56618.1 polysaccharide deacetylase family protein [Bacteroidota bacterium]